MSANNQYPLPHDKTWRHASKLAILEDKPIMYDYCSISKKKALIGVRDSDEKLLVKSEEKY